jgi:hypothetical protein
MKSFYWVLMLTAMCGTAHSAPNPLGFEFAQGVIVDVSHSAVYMSNGQATIDAVSLSNGEVIATSTRGVQPLLLYDDVLLAAAQDRSDALSVIGLTATDLKPKFQLELPLPGGVRTGSFYVGARISGNQIILQWRSVQRAMSPIPNREPARVTTGFAHVDPVTGRLISASEGEPPAPTSSQSKIPAAAQELANNGGLASPLCPVDDLAAALQHVEENGKRSMILRRWSRDTGKTMPAVTLFDSEFTFRGFSRDCRYLLASKEMNGFLWHIYSTVTGQQISEIHNPLPGPNFFVFEGKLLYEAPASGQSIDGRLRIDAPRLVAIGLDNGKERWARPIGETTFVGPYPGNPPVPAAPPSGGDR